MERGRIQAEGRVRALTLHDRSCAPASVNAHLKACHSSVEMDLAPSNRFTFTFI